MTGMCVWDYVFMCVCVKGRRKKEKGESNWWQCCSAVSSTVCLGLLLVRKSTQTTLTKTYGFKHLDTHRHTQEQIHTNTEEDRSFITSSPVHSLDSTRQLLSWILKAWPPCNLKNKGGGWFWGHKTLRGYPQSVLFAMPLTPPPAP